MCPNTYPVLISCSLVRTVPGKYVHMSAVPIIYVIAIANHTMGTSGFAWYNYVAVACYTCKVQDRLFMRVDTVTISLYQASNEYSIVQVKHRLDVYTFKLTT